MSPDKPSREQKRGKGEALPILVGPQSFCRSRENLKERLEKLERDFREARIKISRGFDPDLWFKYVPFSPLELRQILTQEVNFTEKSYSSPHKTNPIIIAESFWERTGSESWAMRNPPFLKEEDFPQINFDVLGFWEKAHETKKGMFYQAEIGATLETYPANGVARFDPYMSSREENRPCLYFTNDDAGLMAEITRDRMESMRHAAEIAQHGQEPETELGKKLFRFLKESFDMNPEGIKKFLQKKQKLPPRIQASLSFLKELLPAVEEVCRQMKIPTIVVVEPSALALGIQGRPDGIITPEILKSLEFELTEKEGAGGVIEWKKEVSKT